MLALLIVFVSGLCAGAALTAFVYTVTEKTLNDL